MEIKDVVIGRPRWEDLAALHEFFELMLTDTFRANGIENEAVLKHEIEDKKNKIADDLEHDGSEIFFLLALGGNEVIGTIEYGPSNELLNQCSENKLKDVLEIGTIFVHPDYRKRGVATKLIGELFRVLSEKSVEVVCFDSGYRLAQEIWTQKFGEPEYKSIDFWGPGSHHLVWRIDVATYLNSLQYNPKNQIILK